MGERGFKNEDDVCAALCQIRELLYSPVRTVRVRLNTRADRVWKTKGCTGQRLPPRRARHVPSLHITPRPLIV